MMGGPNRDSLVSDSKSVDRQSVDMNKYHREKFKLSQMQGAVENDEILWQNDIDQNNPSYVDPRKSGTRQGVPSMIQMPH